MNWDAGKKGKVVCNEGNLRNSLIKNIGLSKRAGDGILSREDSHQASNRNVPENSLNGQFKRN